jgi:glycosyltransferase involved in cell wall biosynthesis
MSAGPTDVSAGPTDVSAGPTDVSAGPTDVSAGPTDPAPTPSARIAVVIPTFQRAATVRRAVDSVLAQEGVSGIEVVVVDDGSTDGTAAVLSAIDDDRVQVVHQANRGRCDARNAGARAASAPVLTFLDSDDEALPGWLAAIAAEATAPVIRLGVVQDRGGEVRRIPAGELDPDRPFPRGACQPGSFAVAADLFDRVGGYDPRFDFSENSELLVRLALAAGREGWSGVSSPVFGVLLHQEGVAGRTERYSDAPRQAAELLLDRYPRELRADRSMRADLLAIVGTDELRAGRRGRAASAFARAWWARPASLVALARLASVVLPDAVRRRLRPPG